MSFCQIGSSPILGSLEEKAQSFLALANKSFSAENGWLLRSIMMMMGVAILGMNLLSTSLTLLTSNSGSRTHYILFPRKRERERERGMNERTLAPHANGTLTFIPSEQNSLLSYCIRIEEKCTKILSSAF